MGPMLDWFGLRYTQGVSWLQTRRFRTQALEAIYTEGVPI